MQREKELQAISDYNVFIRSEFNKSFYGDEDS